MKTTSKIREELNAKIENDNSEMIAESAIRDAVRDLSYIDEQHPAIEMIEMQIGKYLFRFGNTVRRGLSAETHTRDQADAIALRECMKMAATEIVRRLYQF